ncbi:TAXI family TRAP transporter solute-binding subunit [Rubinisphaera sp.]|uniref:TAXI family TRAP transporter solute-binding subunit n=1 Tax=Rubinisphaera sp. TaxID=2024857 RepID=UPI0025E6B960|nr:TAXI family TRAP transporter solute-binding subunit [Rubinisphaera sp.]|tara:strand:+ start:432 stop:1853 length:1422 start_codon:yes stop_codon:yes gene_type:complete
MNNTYSKLWMLAKWLFVALLIGLPIVFTQWYRQYLKLPETITIATGTESGQYQQVGRILGQELTQRYGIKVNQLTTDGAGENVLNVIRGEADIAFYQRGTVELQDNPDHMILGRLTSIGSLYSEVVHFLVQPDHTDTPISQMQNFRIAIGSERSGTELVARYLLQQFHMDDQVQFINLSLDQLRNAFINGEIDAAFITAGVQAPMLEQLLKPEPDGSTACVLTSIPFTEALGKKSGFLESYLIPKGMYDQSLRGAPDEPIATLAARAQLITSETVSVRLIELITTILNDPEFQSRARLNELLIGGTNFAQENLDFPLHPGAQHIYEPQLKPLLNVDFVEATEGIRSFVVSLLIAAFFLIKWIRDYRNRSQEHKLDRYIKKLLVIEHDQKFLDQNDQTDDRKRLQDMLDDVTDLRQQAMKEFTAHEINSDLAIACFVSMCHALSDKINAKISRQRLDARLRQITAQIEKPTSVN